MSPRPVTVPRHLFQHYAGAKPRNLPRAKGRQEKPATGRMNKGEAAYASELEARVREGHVAAFWFEALTIKLAPDTHYRPDFLVQLPDGTLEIHEVKGRKGDTFYATEDGWLRVKVVAEAFPFVLRVVWPAKGGGWMERVVGEATSRRAA